MTARLANLKGSRHSLRASIRRMTIRLVVLALALLVGSTSARADVVDRGPNGFTVRTAVTIAAPPDRVFATLVRVGEWWDPAHTWSGDARNLRLDATPGGCFCEALPAGGGVRHAEVVYVESGKLLRLNGSLGPLQSMGVNGSLTWQLEKSGEGTAATVTYVVGGYVPGGADALAAPVDGVMAIQIRRLKALLER